MWCHVKCERDHEAIDPSSFAEVCLTLSIRFTNPKFQLTQNGCAFPLDDGSDCRIEQLHKH